MPIKEHYNTEVNMFDIVKVGIDQIEEFAELRSAVLMETNNLTDSKEKERFYDNNLVYLKEAIPSGKFLAFMAKKNKKIVATSAIVFFQIAPCNSVPNGKVGYIQNMYTIKEYRRQGLASMLLERTIDEAKRYRCSKISLNATKMGRKLYEKSGFTETADEMELFI
jgi:GNAT superfamily N-acetyltransferase